MNAQTTSGNGKEIESSSSSQKRSKSAQPQNKSPQPPSWKGEQKTTSKTTGSPRRLAARDDDHIGPTPSGPGGSLEEINPYLPVSFANPDEATYIRSLKETFELNYSNEKFEFPISRFTSSIWVSPPSPSGKYALPVKRILKTRSLDSTATGRTASSGPTPRSHFCKT